MKFLVFIRGESSELRTETLDRIMQGLNPDINHVRAIRVGMSDYGPFKDRGERKAAASSVKKMVRKLLSGSHQEQFIVVDNPNLNPRDWQSMFQIATSVSVEIGGVGINMEKLADGDEDGSKNEQDPNLRLFIAMMDKYVGVQNEQDIELAIETLLDLNEQ